MSVNVTHGLPDRDIEMSGPGANDDLFNNVVRSFSWDGVSVTVKDRSTGKPRQLLSDVNGMVKAGEMLALMGPSGSGKTTLLNVLAHRTELLRGTVQQNYIHINHTPTRLGTFRRLSGYVEQEDALVGALTVRETLYFAAQLALPPSVSKAQRKRRIDELVAAFGLGGQADTLIGSPLRKGVSGGQKRRVSVASALITSPKILFLDEPTSGLDSTASFEVINYLRQVAKRHNIIVVASIHQPSSLTFQLFDKLLLLSQGSAVYNGTVADVPSYFEATGHPIPPFTNPAEFVLDLVNVDFAPNAAEASANLTQLKNALAESSSSSSSRDQKSASGQHTNGGDSVESTRDVDSAAGESLASSKPEKAGALTVWLALVHRSFIKGYRDLVAYWIRVAMYLGLAIMMGTVWLRLSSVQADIQPYINAIFFGGAFKSFMAVAYIPAFLEDRTLFVKERSNGLYGPLAFVTANFATGAPFLFLISALFSVVSYWLSNFRPTAGGFWMWVLYLFLDLLAAESLVVLVASLAPIFVVALAATAFANGLWMSVGGFLVPLTRLNAFYRYAFSYIDYQRWVFQGMMVNEFATRTYDCEPLEGASSGSDCQCMYQTELADQCKIAGTGVLKAYGYKTGEHGMYIGIILAIVLGYRLLGLGALYAKRT